MKDIRTDIRERIASIKKEIDSLEERLEYLEEARDSAEILLALEETMWEKTDGKQADFVSDRNDAYKDSTPLSGMIRTVLDDGKKHHLDELVEIANLMGYPFGGKSPGRVVHFALTSLLKNGVVEQAGDGLWRAVK